VVGKLYGGKWRCEMEMMQKAAERGVSLVLF
jgi:hypothetical protein